MVDPALRTFALRAVLSLPRAVLRGLAGGGVVYVGGRTLDPRLQFLASQARRLPPLSSLTPLEARAGTVAAFGPLAGKVEAKVRIEALTVPGGEGPIAARAYRGADQDPGRTADGIRPLRRRRDRGSGHLRAFLLDPGGARPLPRAVGELPPGAGASLSRRPGGHARRLSLGARQCGAVWSAGRPGRGGRRFHGRQLRRGDRPGDEADWRAGPGPATSDLPRSGRGQREPLHDHLWRILPPAALGHGLVQGPLPAARRRAQRSQALAATGQGPCRPGSGGDRRGRVRTPARSGESYARGLGEAGVPVVYRCYDNLAHAFTAFIGVVPAADLACRQIADLARAATPHAAPHAEP